MAERMVAILVAALAVALVAAGCGGGDGSDKSDSSSTGSNVKGAVVICEEGAETIRTGVSSYVELAGKIGNSLTPEQERQVAQDIVYRGIEEAIAEVAALPTSQGSSPQAAAILDSLKGGRAQIKQDPNVVYGGKSISTAEAAAAAKAFALEICGQV